MEYSVSLVGYTLPVDLSDPLHIISDCARVSNPDNQGNYETSMRLMEYLTDNSHWSPLEMVNIVMEINAPRDIARHILRHRSFSFQEFSQRYAEVQNFTTRECRLQDHTNRQNSYETQDKELLELWDALQYEMRDHAVRKYKAALDRGIAKEVARTILPEGLTMSKIYMNGTLRSWIHYCQLRCGNGTQKEHREVATLCREHILEIFPWLEGVLNEF